MSTGKWGKIIKSNTSKFNRNLLSKWINYSWKRLKNVQDIEDNYSTYIIYLRDAEDYI